MSTGDADNSCIRTFKCKDRNDKSYKNYCQIGSALQNAWNLLANIDFQFEK